MARKLRLPNLTTPLPNAKEGTNLKIHTSALAASLVDCMTLRINMSSGKIPPRMKCTKKLMT